MSQQTWTVLEWGVIDGDILGAIIVCPFCESDVTAPCDWCNGDRRLHQPYRLPNGAPIDLNRDAELLIQIEPPEPIPPQPEPDR